MRFKTPPPATVPAQRRGNPFRPNLPQIIAAELERGFASPFLCLREQAILSAHTVLEMIARHISVASDSQLDSTIAIAIEKFLCHEEQEGDLDQANEADELDNGECAPEETDALECDHERIHSGLTMPQMLNIIGKQQTLPIGGVA